MNKYIEKFKKRHPEGCLFMLTFGLSYILVSFLYKRSDLINYSAQDTAPQYSVFVAETLTFCRSSL